MTPHCPRCCMPGLGCRQRHRHQHRRQCHLQTRHPHHREPGLGCQQLQGCLHPYLLHPTAHRPRHCMPGLHCRQRRRRQHPRLCHPCGPARCLHQQCSGQRAFQCMPGLLCQRRHDVLRLRPHHAATHRWRQRMPGLRCRKRHGGPRPRRRALKRTRVRRRHRSRSAPSRHLWASLAQAFTKNLSIGPHEGRLCVRCKREQRGVDVQSSCGVRECSPTRSHHSDGHLHLPTR